MICRMNQTRHLYYLQLRRDILSERIYCHEETALLLASYSLQAEKGDYGLAFEGTEYYQLEDYMSEKVTFLTFAIVVPASVLVCRQLVNLQKIKSIAFFLTCTQNLKDSAKNQLSGSSYRLFNSVTVDVILPVTQ